jgi:mRNA interferase MazF
MATTLARGQIWMLDRPAPDKRRPVLILSRDELLGVLHTVTVAAITSTLRGSPTEVALGEEEGLKAVSCVNMVNLFTVPKAALRRYVGSASDQRMDAVCRALAIAVGCA